MTSSDDLITRVQARRRLPPPELRRAIRKAAGATQAEVAAALDPPVTRATVCRWESGVRQPGAENIAGYSTLLDRLSEATK